jgi:integrase
MAVYKQPKSRNWWYKFTWNGQQIRESTKQSNKRVAEQIEAARRTALAKGEVGIRDKKPVPTLAAFITADFLPFVRTTFAAKVKTKAYYENGAKHLLAFDKLASEPLAHRERVLTDAEEAIYLANSTPLLHDVATILIDCGLRPEECFRLQWSSARDGQIEIQYGKTDNARRHIPVSQRVAAVLEMRKTGNDSPWVFPAPTKSGHMEPSTVRKSHVKACKGGKKKANEWAVQPFPLYTLRHTCLTRWAPHMDPWTLAHLAGHRDMAITKRGFLERQVQGWAARWKHAKTEELPDMDRAIRWLADRMPDSAAATLVHNDYKLDNVVMIGPAGDRVEAVLDWEMTTLGDPLADLGLTMCCWAWIGMLGRRIKAGRLP